MYDKDTLHKCLYRILDPDFQKYLFMIAMQFLNGFLSEVLSAHGNPLPDFLENASQRLLSDMLEIYFKRPI